MNIASGDGHGRPPRPEIDRREVRPHLCTRRAGARVRTCTCLEAAPDALVGSIGWASTVGIVSPVGSVAEPEPTITIVTPALDGRVVLRRKASEHHSRFINQGSLSPKSFLSGELVFDPSFTRVWRHGSRGVRRFTCFGFLLGFGSKLHYVQGQVQPDSRSSSDNLRMIGLCYQERASVRIARSDGQGRPPKPKID